MLHKLNPNWAAMQNGDPVVTPLFRTKYGKLMPFLLELIENGDRCRGPFGGSYIIDVVWPYGAPEIEPIGYADFNINPYKMNPL